MIRPHPPEKGCGEVVAVAVAILVTLVAAIVLG